MKHLLFFLAFLAVVSACALTPGPAHAATAPAERQMIVAAERDASEAGLEMLRAGGSAVDAAIAAQLVLTLVEPQSSGNGGSAYIMVSDGDELYAYDGRETAPASATPELYLDEQGNPRSLREVGFGGISVGVPGTIAVMAMAHRTHGRLPWEQLFGPAIELAESGFAVPERLADGLARGRGRERFARPARHARLFLSRGRYALSRRRDAAQFGTRRNLSSARSTGRTGFLPWRAGRRDR